MVNWKSQRLGDLLLFANGVVIVLLLNVLSSAYFVRLDLTEENRYTIQPQTREILSSLEDDVYIEVFLEGDLNASFSRFRKSIEETLEEFRIYSHNKVKFAFVNPAAAKGKKAQSEYMADLAARGIQPTNVIDKKDGQRVEKIIFPGAIVSYGGFESGVMLLKGNKARTSEEQINQSIEGIEFELVNAIHKLTNENRKTIGLLTGHGELDSLQTTSLRESLSEFYDVSPVTLNDSTALTTINALIIAKPVRAFSPLEKFKLDQFILTGGKVLFLIDKLEVNMDSISREDYYAFPYPVNLDDQLFKYGVRVNMDLVQDQNSGVTPVIIGQSGGRPQVQLMEWPFYPLLNNYPEHPITRNLDAVLTRFVSSVDTVKAVGIRKTPLLMTSSYSRTVTAPVPVSLSSLRQNLRAEDFSKAQIPVGFLLEGSFESLYKNRFLPDGANTTTFVESGKPTKLIVLADGDLARNEINPRTKLPQPLGFDPFTNYTFANRDFLMNAIAYLMDEGGLIQARSKQVKIRPLDKEKIKNEKVKWQVINIALPMVLLLFFGLVRAYWRKKKYSQF